MYRVFRLNIHTSVYTSSKTQMQNNAKLVYIVRAIIEYLDVLKVHRRNEKQNIQEIYQLSICT